MISDPWYRAPPRGAPMEFSENQIQRYARHILLDEVGGEGRGEDKDNQAGGGERFHGVD